MWCKGEGSRKVCREARLTRNGEGNSTARREAELALQGGQTDAAACNRLGRWWYEMALWYGLVWYDTNWMSKTATGYGETGERVRCTVVLEPGLGLTLRELS